MQVAAAWQWGGAEGAFFMTEAILFLYFINKRKYKFDVIYLLGYFIGMPQFLYWKTCSWETMR